MGILRRYWPVAFLIAFVLLLTFHATPPFRRLEPLGSRPPSEDQSVPEGTGAAAGPNAPSIAAASPTPNAADPKAAEEEAQPRAKSSVLDGLLWALKNQNADGSWGDESTTLGDRTIGRTGVTSLVLLPLTGAGYCHLSKDEYDGIAVGPSVKKAILWLLSQQREDGTFKSGHDESFDQALAAIALSELYGMTASQPLKDPTTLALDALVRLQQDDGSWGGSQPTLWAAQALISGEWSEVPYPTETRDRMLAWFRAHPSPAQLEIRVLLKDHPEALESLSQSLMSDLPRPGETTFDHLLHATSGLYRYDGAEGVLWKKWNEPARQAVLSTQNQDGSWNGGTLSNRLVRTSLAMLTLETYYRTCSSVFTLRK